MYLQCICYRYKRTDLCKNELLLSNVKTYTRWIFVRTYYRSMTFRVYQCLESANWENQFHCRENIRPHFFFFFHWHFNLSYCDNDFVTKKNYFIKLASFSCFYYKTYFLDSHFQDALFKLKHQTINNDTKSVIEICVSIYFASHEFMLVLVWKFMRSHLPVTLHIGQRYTTFHFLTNN